MNYKIIWFCIAAGRDFEKHQPDRNDDEKYDDEITENFVSKRKAAKQR